MKRSLFYIVSGCTLWVILMFFYRFTQTESYIRHYPHEIHEDTQSGSSPAPAPSPEDKELQNLLRMTAWNIAPLPGDFQLSTSHSNSSYTLLHPRSTYTMGETIEVLITAKDHKGRPKTYGGDFFNVKLYSTSMKAGVSGSVKDHNDGTYTATFLLVWPGETKISVRLMHSSEAIAILHEKRDSRPDKIYFRGHFELNGTREVVECNFDLPGRDVCEYYDAGSGEKWVCLRPKTLPCNSYREHSAGGSRDILNDKEMEFLSMSFTDQEIPTNLKPLQVLPNKSSRNRTRTTCTSGLPIPNPSGFYYQDLWESLVCSNQHFPDASSVANCLAGKNVYMFGDSTLRQWWSYLVDLIPTLKEIDLHSPYHPGPHLATDSEHNYLVQWRAHQKPLRMEKTWLRELHYIASELDNLGGRNGLVIVINCWAHFLTFPIETYVRRLRGIRDGVKRLLELNSEVTILIKSANTGYRFAHASDWLSIQLDTVMRAMFSDLPVTILDVWQMTSCHREPENLHPPKVIVKNEIDLMLSFICPS
ncbi:NXPE family member 3-like [Xenopus tropicalis]|uniref:NXPE family member 3-like n=1 Tax=Xenopus tropicalis TaxID=8364 RepID=A0A6I8PM73_XENTR|nr:NXPE family member 3-like [Xenopus tropicalis]